MENLEKYISKINNHSLIHLGLSAVTSSLSVLFAFILHHWPLIVTLTVTSIITFCSGLAGRRLKSNTKGSVIKTYFILQIVLLCSWDFGGIICVITIALGYKSLSQPIFIIITISSSLIYISAFIYFWKSFILVNHLMVFMKNPKRFKSSSFIVTGAKIAPIKSPLLAGNLVSPTSKLQDTTHTINSGSVVTSQ